jgi:hypothetical protein
MKKIFFYSLSLLILSSFTELNAQESKPVPNDNPALKEAAIKAKAQRMETQKNKPAPAQLAVTKPASKSPIDENDIYMGRKAEFLSNLTVNDLPTDFPKYDKSYGLRYYNNLVDNFYFTHKDILKDGPRQKLEKSNPFVSPQTISPNNKH